MKLKSEKGVTGIDTVVGIIIFMVGSAAVLFIYLNMYKIIAQMKVNEEIIALATDILEIVDKENYDDVDENRINSIIQSSNIPDSLQVSCTITKYVDQVAQNRLENGQTGEEVEDLVKRVTLNFKYSPFDMNRNYTISRVKVREL